MACNIKNDPKAFYQHAGKKMKTNESVSHLINDNGDVIRDSQCVASMLNHCLVSAFSAEDTNNINNNLPLVDASAYRDMNVLPHIIIMVIFKCYFSREHIVLSYKKWCEHRLRENQQIKSTAHDARSCLK